MHFNCKRGPGPFLFAAGAKSIWVRRMGHNVLSVNCSLAAHTTARARYVPQMHPIRLVLWLISPISNLCLRMQAILTFLLSTAYVNMPTKETSNPITDQS